LLLELAFFGAISVHVIFIEVFEIRPRLVR